MSRRGENIYKRRDGRYEGRYVTGKDISGKTQYGYIYGMKYNDVKHRLLEKKKELTKSQCAKFASGFKFSEWVRQWQIINLRSRIKTSTEQTYYFLLSWYIMPVLGSMNIESIDTDTVVKLLTEMRDKGYAAATINMTLRLLSSILKAAVDSELILKNPCRSIKYGKQQTKTEQRALSVEEQKVLEDSGELFIYLGLYTGMRVGEICGLKWSDIDWENRTITVNRTVQREKQWKEKSRLVAGSPKTESSFRVIPLAEILCSELKKKYSDSNVFIMGKGERPCDPRTLERKLKKITEKAGIDDIHFHSLRHTFATRMISAGIDVKTTSSLLGHSSIKTTLEIYTHSNLDMKKEAIKKLSEVINKPS